MSDPNHHPGYTIPSDPYSWGDEGILRDAREGMALKPPKVLVVGGAGAGKLTLRGTKRALQEEGLDAYTFTPTAKPAPKDPSIPNQRRYQQSKAEQVANVIDSLVDEDEKITLYAHSLGGPVALLAALARPDKVDRVVLSNSEGLSRRNVEARLPFIRLAGRFMLELNARKNLTLTKQGLTQTATGLADIVRHPLSFVGSAKDGARTYAMPMVERLKELGIPVDVITSNMDLVYSAEEAAKTADRESETTVTADGSKVLNEMPFNSISSYYAAKPKLGSRKMPRWLKTDPIPDLKVKDEDDDATRRQKEAAAHTRKMAMRGVRTKRHRLAGKYAGHDQPIIYPRYAAKVVRQIIRPQEVIGGYERFSLSQRVASVAQGVLLDAKDRWSELSRSSRVAAVGLGVLAVAGTAYLARKGFDIGVELDGGITDRPEVAPDTVLPAGPEGGESLMPGDISSSLNLPDGYIKETAGGYEITAMYGNQTDSVWRAAEHALTDRLGSAPTVTQVDALKDLIGEHYLDVGDKLAISNDQIEEALRTATIQ